MEWARNNGYIVFTNDLDFGSLLAFTGVKAPSVIQVRTQDVLPTSIENLVISAMRQFEAELELGALVTIDQAQMRGANFTNQAQIKGRGGFNNS